MVRRDPRRGREQEGSVHNVGERGVSRNPAVEIAGSISFSASGFHSCLDHTHPARKIWWGKLEDIKRDGLLISSTYEEVKFGEIHQTVGSQGLASLINETRIVSYLDPDENAGR